jgi:hypothetical protein
MAQMNKVRIIAGGLAAGVVMNVIDFLANGLWLGSRWQAQAELIRPGMAQQAERMSTAGWVTVDLLAGIIVVWLYAAIRPRFGPGPRTALCAGFVLWLITRLIFASYVFNGFYTWRLIAASSAGSLVAALLGALLGGMLYKEAASA